MKQKINVKTLALIFIGALILTGVGYCGGYLYAKYQGKSVNQTSKKTQGTIEIKEKEGSDLSIFTNTYYQYTFEFPNDWIYNTVTGESDDPITSNQVTDMHTSNGEFVQVMTWNNDQENLSLLEWYEKYETSHYALKENAPQSPNAKVAGLGTLFVTRPTLQAPADITVVFSKEGKIFQLWYVANESGVDYENFLHLLQTFEFNGQVTSDQIPEVTKESLK